MTRIIAALAAPAAGAIALVAGLPAQAATPMVVGKVGPGYTITLTKGGKKVTVLKAGVKYRFVITDRSEDHDFRLVGPATSKVLTGEEFTGAKSTTLTLRRGSYRFFCAPHSDEMKGGFRVG